MRIIKCDRCGKLIDLDQYDNTGYIKWSWRNIFDPADVSPDSPLEKCDYCEDCMNEILAFITTKPDTKPDTAEPEKPETAPAPDQTPTVKTGGPGPATKKFDIGKMQALRIAGWSYAKIADEMGCSQSTVYTRLAELEEKNEGKD